MFEQEKEQKPNRTNYFRLSLVEINTIEYPGKIEWENNKKMYIVLQ